MLCTDRFYETYNRQPDAISFCSYRISPLGAHIDHQWGKINGLAIMCEPVRRDSYTGEAMTFFHDPDGLPIEIHEWNVAGLQA